MLVSKITPDEVVGVTSKSVDFLIMAGTISKAVERYVRYAGELEKIVEMENKSLATDILTERTDLYSSFPSNLFESATVNSGTYDLAKDYDPNTYDSLGSDDILELMLDAPVGEPCYIVVDVSYHVPNTENAKLYYTVDGVSWTLLATWSGTGGSSPRVRTFYSVDDIRGLKIDNNGTTGFACGTLHVIKQSEYDSWLSSCIQNLGNMEYVRLRYPLEDYNRILARLSEPCIYLHNATYEIWDGSQFIGDQPKYKLFENEDLIVKFTSWDQNNSKIGNKLAEHVIESTPASGDYKIQNYGKDIAVIIKGTDYRYRIYDISHVNALPTVISVQR